MLLRILLLPWILLVHDIISRGLGPWVDGEGRLPPGRLSLNEIQCVHILYYPVKILKSTPDYSNKVLQSTPKYSKEVLQSTPYYPV